METRVKRAGVFKNAFFRVSANAKTTTTTYTFRKNRADTAITFSIGAGVTTTFEDTSNSVSVAAEDEVDWKAVFATDTNNITFDMISIDFVTTDGYHFPVAGMTGASADLTQDFGTTNYWPIGGSAREHTVEADQKIKTRIPITYSNLRVHGQVNTVNGTTTIKFRKNGTDGNQLISIGSATAGWASDDTNTDVCDDDDEVNLICTTAGSSGTITIRNISLMALGPTSTLYQIATTETGYSVTDAITTKRTRTLSEAIGSITDSELLKIKHFKTESGYSVADSELLKIKLSKTETGYSITDTYTRKVKRSLSETAYSILADTVFKKIKMMKSEPSYSVSEDETLKIKRFKTETGYSVSETDLLKIKRQKQEPGYTVADTNSVQVLGKIRRFVTETGYSVADTLAKVKISRRTLAETIGAVSDAATRLKGFRFTVTATEGGYSVTDSATVAKIKIKIVGGVGAVRRNIGSYWSSLRR